MTLAKAKRMLGCDIRIDANPKVKGVFAYACNDDGPFLGTFGSTTNEALTSLVHEVSKDIDAFVLKRAHYRCERCGALKPLQVHHITYRSHGGDHTASNKEALCSADHEGVHNGKRKKA